MFRLATAAAATAVLLALTASAADAADPAADGTPAASTATSTPPASSGPRSGREFLLSVLGEDGGVLREARLSCRPVPTGTHPDPVGACRALEAVRGNIGALPGEPRMCTHQYAPVTISAQGVWDSWTQAYNRTFANTCEMDASTGIVFRF